MTIKLLAHRWIAALCLMAMACLPLEVNGQPNYYNSRYGCDDEPCAPRRAKINQNLWWLLGAAGLGAAAGAGVAAAIATKGTKGATGPKGAPGKNGKTGATGPSAFGHAAGELVFSFLQNSHTPTMIRNPPLINPSLIFPFVSTPDGTVFVGPQSMEASGFNPSITVPNPAFGTYNYGYCCKPGAVNITTITASDPTVEGYHMTEVTISFSGPPTRDQTQDGNTKSAFNTLVTVPIPLAPNNPTTGTGDDIQVTGQFTFGPNMTSPSYTPTMP